MVESTDTPVTAETNAEISEITSEPTNTVMKLLGWNSEGQAGEWSTYFIPNINATVLKGKKLTINGHLKWNDQGTGDQKGSFRLRLLRDGEEVEGSAQIVGPAPHQ